MREKEPGVEVSSVHVRVRNDPCQAQRRGLEFRESHWRGRGCRRYRTGLVHEVAPGVFELHARQFQEGSRG